MPSETTSTYAEEGTIEEIVELVTAVPPFLKHLWNIVNDSNAEHIIGWNSRGNGFIIYDQVKFETELLPQYFKNLCFLSFVRQLNLYGFYKVVNFEKVIEYAHSCLYKELPETLALITRKNKRLISKTNQRQKNEKNNTHGMKGDTEDTTKMVIAEKKPKSVPFFLQRLWKIVNDPNTEHIIGWNSTDDGFIIYDQSKFLTELLPKYFTHKFLSSFIRQLNSYGFHKVANNNKNEMEFEHSCFLKGLPETLALIKRKNSNLKDENIKKSNKGVRENIEESLEIPLFLQNLWNMVEDPNTEHIAGWNSEGDGFIIYDQIKVTELLPQYFKHDNFLSFIRELYSYEFLRVTNFNRHELEFKHSFFYKGSPESLSFITKNKNFQSITSQIEENEMNKCINGLKEDIENTVEMVIPAQNISTITSVPNEEKLKNVVIPEQKAKSVPVFLQGLWKMVNDPKTDHIIGWNSNGDGFIIYDHINITQVLSQYSKQLYLSSFIRQINSYNFQKVANNEKSQMEYAHPFFHKGSPESLAFIKRKRNLKSITNQEEEIEKKRIKCAKENIKETMKMVTPIHSMSPTNISQTAEENVNETVNMIIPEQITISVPLFLQKLWKIVNDSNAVDIIGWNCRGDGFIIYDQIKITELLSQYFKDNSLSSFIRLLNIFNFHRVTNCNDHELEFQHSCFLKRSPECLALITKKREVKSATNQEEEIPKKHKKCVKENTEETVNIVTPIRSISPTRTSQFSEEKVDETIVQTPDSVPMFLQKLWRIVNDPNAQHIIGWNSTGDAFIIYDKTKLTELLSQYYKHNNMFSFIRQLNVYGFHKINVGTHTMEFAHIYFVKGFPENLVFITRKIPKPDGEKVLTKHIKEINAKFSAICNKLQMLKQKNVGLRNEISLLHLKHSKMS